MGVDTIAALVLRPLPEMLSVVAIAGPRLNMRKSRRFAHPVRLAGAVDGADALTIRHRGFTAFDHVRMVNVGANVVDLLSTFRRHDRRFAPENTLGAAHREAKSDLPGGCCPRSCRSNGTAGPASTRT